MKKIWAILTTILLAIPFTFALHNPGPVDTCLIRDQNDPDGPDFYMEFQLGFIFPGGRTAQQFCTALNFLDDLYTAWHPNKDFHEAIVQENTNNPQARQWSENSIFDLFENPAIPEFSTITALVALTGALGFFIYQRKRNGKK